MADEEEIHRNKLIGKTYIRAMLIKVHRCGVSTVICR